MILIISADEDVHATSVTAHLEAQARIIDLRAFPNEASVTFRYGAGQEQRILTYKGEEIHLSDVTAVWWRRPQSYEVSETITDPDARTFAFYECDEAIQGLWALLQDAAWMNPPQDDERAARKAWQLDLAQECGLSVPRSLITNDPEAARAFARAEGVERTIYKAFQGNEAAWRETRLLRAEEFEKLEAVRHAPVIFQEYVEGQDLRVTVIGDQIFPAAIEPGGDYKVDFRMEMGGAKISATSLPAEVEQGLRRLMARMGLVYGAIDLRRRPDGSHVFLEINPAGQWLFVEDQTRQPISRAMAEWLSSHGQALKPVEALIKSCA